MKQITTDELKSMKSVGKEFALINVLPAHEFQSTSIPGARNIPLEDTNFVGHVEQEVGGRTGNVVVYCAGEHCHASTRAAETLEAAGFKNVFDYKDGAKGWQAEVTRVPVA